MCPVGRSAPRASSSTRAIGKHERAGVSRNRRVQLRHKGHAVRMRTLSAVPGRTRSSRELARERSTVSAAYPSGRGVAGPDDPWIAENARNRRGRCTSGPGHGRKLRLHVARLALALLLAKRQEAARQPSRTLHFGVRVRLGTIHASSVKSFASPSPNGSRNASAWRAGTPFSRRRECEKSGGICNQQRSDIALREPPRAQLP